MSAIVALAEGDAWLAVSVTRDPEALLRSYRSRNKRITGIALCLRCANEVAGGRIVARALDLIERQGTRRDGRYVGVTAAVLEARLRESAGALGVPVYSAEQWLALGAARLERQAQGGG